MRLLRARFSNFRLLRNLELDFRLAGNKKLIVLRGENESGKTTILNGLQWGLFGDDAIPRDRGAYRLHPIDWDRSQGVRVPITVEIDFEVTNTHRTRSGELRISTTEYRLIRSTSDTLSGETWSPGPTTSILFEATPQGDRPIEPPDATIFEQLPPELREVFFTDGDRALSFIEADVSASTKQAKVRDAIRNLLGLDIIEGARLRIKKAGSAINSRVKSQFSNADLQRSVDRIGRLERQVEELEEKLQEAETQFNAFDEEWASTGRRLEDLLARGGGDRTKLVSRIQQTAASIESTNKQIVAANREHSGLFRSLELARDLLGPALAPSFAILDELRDRGDIPDTTIPVLEDRLGAATCICGEPLQGNAEEAVHRREHIQSLIDQARHGDAARAVATNLYFASTDLQAPSGSRGTWASLYDSTAARRDALEETRKSLGQLQASLEAELAQVPDADVDSLRRHRNECQRQRDRFNSMRSRLSNELTNTAQELANERNRREALLRRQNTGQRLMAELEVAQDLENILNNAYDRLTNEELAKVSSQMNSIFLDMIVADREQRALVRRAEITNQFEIMVYGTQDRPLNPDIDLNGASRRALTLAFILALTKVSEVEAPNVIDTPLGMMSGLVKEAVLTKAITESSQLILLLTQSEIEGCQGILDANAARVITLTNPAHYPTMLVNPPDGDAAGILRCDCDHNHACRTCQRRDTLEPMSSPLVEVP